MDKEIEVVMDEKDGLDFDLVQLARLALLEKSEDVRLFVARLVKRYQASKPELSGKLNEYLKVRQAGRSSALRKVEFDGGFAGGGESFPNDTQGSPYLRRFDSSGSVNRPLLSKDLERTVAQIIQERLEAPRLEAVGLHPTSTVVFVGNPGVGKTLTARWIAEQLDLPLYVLDLALIMGSHLGQTGANLRRAFEFVRTTPCVFLLDEIDAIAKRRGDESDIGEIKRVVTVMLQEIENWPTTTLLVAATNHAELIDPALWRRFDNVLEFGLPGSDLLLKAVESNLGPDLEKFSAYTEILARVMRGRSFSDVERSMRRIRRTLTLTPTSVHELVEELIESSTLLDDKAERLKLAGDLQKVGGMSQRRISDLTGVSRDTIRKHSAELPA